MIFGSKFNYEQFSPYQKLINFSDSISYNNLNRTIDLRCNDHSFQLNYQQQRYEQYKTALNAHKNLYNPYGVTDFKGFLISGAAIGLLELFNSN